MVMLIVFSLAAIVISSSTSQTKMQLSYESSTKALHAAEAGINKYLWSINKEGSTIDLDTIITYPDINPKYAFILHEDINTSEKKVVTSTGWTIHNPEETQSVTSSMMKRSFTQHVYFTDEEPADVWWMTGDKCYGPYRNNSTLYVKGTPSFYGPVYHVNGIETHPDGAAPNYYGGPPIASTRMDLPASNTGLMELASTGGLYLEGRTSIMMNDDGTITIWNPRGPNPNRYTRNLPANGVIYVNSKSGGSTSRFSEYAGNVFISGKLKGRLTVAAANDIYITDYDPTHNSFNTAKGYGQTDGVSYANTDFAFDSVNNEYDKTGSGNDMLGLIANNDIVILTKGWFNNPSVESGVGNIKVYGAVMAVDGKFRNSDHTEYPYDPASDNDISKVAKLILRGAMIQKFRGKVGRVSTEQRHYWWGGSYYVTVTTGYSKDYAHDTRMMSEAPPHFLEPVNSGWEVTSWD